MAARLSKIAIIGNIGVVPELKNKEDQQPFAVFTVGVSPKPRRGKPPRNTTWYRVTLWGKQAEVAVKNGYKGQQVYVAGELEVDEWTDRDGKARVTLEVAGDDFQMLGESAAAQAERTDEAIAADRRTRGGASAAADTAAAASAADGAGDEAGSIAEGY